MTSRANALQQVVNPLVTVLKGSGAIDAVKSGLDHAMDDIPWLMKGLDEVAKIHPFVAGRMHSLRRARCTNAVHAVAVLAFKAVYTMDMTRRNNDKKIVMLYVSMKDMIAVLVQYVFLSTMKHALLTCLRCS